MVGAEGETFGLLRGPITKEVIDWAGVDGDAFAHKLQADPNAVSPSISAQIDSMAAIRRPAHFTPRSRTCFTGPQAMDARYLA